MQKIMKLLNQLLSFSLLHLLRIQVSRSNKKKLLRFILLMICTVMLRSSVGFFYTFAALRA